MLKLDLAPFNDNKISYAFNSDRFIRGVREEHAFTWSRVSLDIILEGSVADTETLSAFIPRLLPNYFPVIREENRIYTINRRILAVESVARLRFDY